MDRFRQLLMLLCVFLYLRVEAQPYKSIFGKQSTSCTQLEYWTVLTAQTKSDILVEVEKDTLVQNKTYKKIVSKKQPFFSNNPDFETIDYSGLLREDTLAGLVWYKEYRTDICGLDTTEKLIFDFNLQVGDTFNIGDQYFYPDTLKVVDSVFYVNGAKHIRFNSLKFGPPPPLEKFEFIEGVGSNGGFLYKHSCKKYGGSTLLCAYKDGVQTYTNTVYNGSCDPFNSLAVPQPLKQEQFIVYPNPATDKLTIEGIPDCGEPLLYEIINSVGITVCTGSIVRSDQNIQIAHLPNGIYMFVIRKEGKHLVSTFFKQ